ncbi:hypothetical protein SAMD00019534_082270 [Acytostelium subglobosum LB1]|uniref:hypothetical protein n=1 Tax=Acytostelium subglobosum LB1 TaxID=1410327 RepID=UPI000644D031|nr:hypothetical protein SAMD00019534_082270 [Acytostelium subglobosum LB1]GAM25052.1 hypothetical protein SAMD00019534_082270 [Acytostelium subglobosum LB1]|eukprot:XP_012752141.1 hypothetical protein SAMD00019534_082270 [Acytostelium subglobosum LB1]
MSSQIKTRKKSTRDSNVGNSGNIGNGSGSSSSSSSTTTSNHAGGTTRRDKPINYKWAYDMLNWSDGSFTTFTPTQFKLNALFTFIVFIVTLALYARTQYPSVAGGDAGELIINAHQLGIAHPPGYPLFTMLGRVFDKFIPFGTVGWRIALFSSFCGAICSAAMFLTVQLWVNDTWCAFATAGLFTFSPLIWCYHIQGEVFSMNNMFVALLVLEAVWYVRTRIFENERFNPSFWTSDRIAYLSAFTCAIGLTNQHTLVLVVVPFAFWLMLIAGRDHLWSINNLTNLTIATLSGLSPYLYLIIAPTLRPTEYSWGNTSTLKGFMTHFLREEYGTLQLYSGDSGSTTLSQRIILYFENIFEQFNYVGGVLAFIGLVGLLLGSNLRTFQWRSVGTMIIFTFTFYITFFFNLCNLPIEKPLYKGVFLRFFMQPNVFISIGIGLGLKIVSNLLNSKAPTIKKITLPLLALGLVAFQIGTNYQLQDQSENLSYVYYGHAVLDPLPKDTLLLVGGDLITNVPQYMKLCEGLRPDIDIISLEEMSWDWFTVTQGPIYKNVNFPGTVYHPHKPGGFSLKTFLDHNQHRPIYLGGDFKHGDYSFQQHYVTLTRGMTSQIIPASAPKGHYQTLLKEYRQFPWFPLPNNTVKYPNDSWEYFLVTDVAINLEKSVENLLTHYLRETGAESEDALKLAIEIMQKVLTIRSTKCWTLKHLGVAADHLRYRLAQKDSGSYERYTTILHDAWARYMVHCEKEKDQDWDTITSVVKQQVRA